MPKNKSKARKIWRQKRAERTQLDPNERLLMAIFGQSVGPSLDEKPGTEFGK